jgi:hypothetical protein
VRPDYKGKAEFKALNDFGTAESKDIVKSYFFIAGCKKQKQSQAAAWED